MIYFSLVSPRPAAYSRSRSCCLRWRRLRMRNLYCCHSHRHRTRCTRRRIHCANRPCIRCIRDPTPRRSSSSSPMATILSKHIADATTLARCDRIRWWWVAAWRSNYYIYISCSDLLITCLICLQGDNYRRGDGFSTTRSVKKVSRDL